MLLPVFMMFLWINLVILYGLVVRIKAVQSGEVKARYFKVFVGEKTPERILKLNRHITNLFEMPPIFMITGVAVIALGLDDGTFANLGWVFVAIRAAHSYIHLGRNHVIARLLVFAASCLVLLVIWLRIMMLSLAG